MPIKILIIDDSATIRMQVGRALTVAGYAAIDAGDGLLGLAAWAENPDVGLVVCDINMPNMNGLEFLEHLNEAQRKTPVVMLTTETDTELSQRAKLLGARGWIVKPFKADLVLAAVKRLTT